MHIQWRDPADRDELAALIGCESNAKQRDRYRCVVLAIEGHDAPTIAQMLGRSRKFVQRWAYAYRDGGIGAIGEKPRSGRPTKLPRELEETFRQRMLAGPTEAMAACARCGARTRCGCWKRSSASPTRSTAPTTCCTAWASRA